MAISTYAELQTAVGNWMARSDLSGSAADFIMLGEARLNREIPAVETDVTLTGTLNSRRISVSSNSVVSPIALFLVEANGDEIEMVQRSDGSFAYSATSDQPRFWAMDGSNIDFDCPLDAAYTFRFRIRQRFALSDSAPTNWLLTNHPDIYLAATLMWGGVFTQDSGIGTTFLQVLKEGVPQVQHIIAEQSRGTLTVDPALSWSGRGAYYDGSE